MDLIVLDNLPERYSEKWERQFTIPERTAAEGVWRRTQNEKNKWESGWRSEQDCRRRMIHFYDQYDVVSDNGKCRLIIKDVYLWLCTSLPKNEMADYVNRVFNTALEHGWKRENNILFKDDLSIALTFFEVHPEDEKAGRSLPEDYQTLEVTLSSNPNFKPNQNSPWDVLASGIRTKGIRSETPTITNDVGELRNYLPFQVELGGGASIELGIPPLNHLHEIYQVNNIETNKYAFGEDDGLLVRILTNYQSFYKEEASLAYVKSLLAEPNEFYLTLADLYKKEILIGDVLTNNFDGLISLVGLKERYLRKYNDTDIVPNIKFAEGAKSLVVIGSHADRRLVQESARRQGLKVIHVDPEEYFDYVGTQIPYPLESLKDEDILVRMKAVDFGKAMRKVYLDSDI